VDFFLQFLAEAGTVGRQQVGAYQHVVIPGRFHIGEAQDQALFVQYPAALDRGALVVGDGQQRVEVLRTHQRTAEFHGDGKVAVVLVRIDAGQGEALDLLLLRLDRFAAGRGQLPGFIALAGAQRQQQEQRNEKRAHPLDARACLCLRFRFHARLPAMIVPAV
jgi:hypothetical protein